MSNINVVVITGRLTRDCEMKYTNSGMAVCKFSVAVGKKKKKDEEWVDDVSFFDVTLFGKAAESISQYLEKGKEVAVNGELRQSRWEQDGNKRSKVEIIANYVQLIGWRQVDAPQQQSALEASDQELEDDIPF